MVKVTHVFERVSSGALICAGPSRNPPDDHVLLEADQFVAFALQGGVGEHLGRLLEGRGREPMSTMSPVAGGDEQKLVQPYAVSVFASFLAAALGNARLTYLDRSWPQLLLSLLGAALVAVVLVLNLTRVDSAIALLASCAVGLYL